ncbi:MAG: (2Fe-2S)-binding protein [Candidatus Hodarchaeales archaeon]|jgi:aerobic-type carbon monoxide dehydrogenase small subunit (CoxS/CutS family)
METTLTVNGRKYSFDCDPDETLLQILRERLQFTGTKNGCKSGHCGACTVVMNGEAVKACLQKSKKFNGADITTIEGISPQTLDGKLHPIQQAFIDTTAVQCGFCTPGYIMELYALYTSNLDASEDEIRLALDNKHLCRCTGYKPILDAALLAQSRLKHESSR